MRPIVPLIFKGIKPIDMAGVTGFQCIEVAPTDIYVDESYQRELSQKSMALIRSMIEGWSWAKFKAPTCVVRDGRLVAIDGQHTATAAASHGGIPLIPVVVVSAPTVVEQADAFISHSKDRVIATRGQIHHAALAAGDQDAIRLQRVVDSAGMKLVLSPKPVLAYRPGETFAVGTVRGILKARGDKLTRDVLSALVLSRIAPVSGDDIKAADMLLCEPDYAAEFDVEKVASAFRDMTPAQKQEAEALSVAKSMPMWKATGAVLCRAAKAPKPRTPKPAEASSTFTPLAKVRLSEMPSSYPFGDPEPGRSALDERRRATAA